MKRAFAYIRISQEDQSNFSLSGQRKMNTEYAEKHGIDIIQTFVDDGYSAKNFNRPQWKQLEAALSANKTTIDYLIVTKYDRLIRNAAEGLAFIEKLEQRWNIKLLSVMENFFIDPHSPYFFKMRADLLVTAEFERRVISDRSKFGTWSAKSQGRFIGPAPFGYLNARDEGNKPVIVMNKELSEVIRNIFLDYLNGCNFPIIIDNARKKGFQLKGHDSIKRILSNPTYAGLIQVPAYKDSISKVIKATHEPIIDESVFWKAFYKLQEQIRPQGAKIIDENLPLRGYILCNCRTPHTGGKSKGRSAYYYYYRCRSCKNENYRADKVHNRISELLSSISLPDKLVKALLTECNIQFKEQIKDRDVRLKKVTKEIHELKAKINSLEQKYISDTIELSTYQKWSGIYNRDYKGLAIEYAELTSDKNELLELYNKYIPMLADINWIYSIGDVDCKQSILKCIFPSGLIVDKKGLRTIFMNEIFLFNKLKINGLIEITGDPENEKFPESPNCTPIGNKIEPLLRVFKRVIELKKAS